MNWKSLLEGRPTIVAIAGSNGAGKSTFYESHLAASGLPFINADEIALAFGMGAYDAAATAGEIRAKMVEDRESFIFETVLSDPVGQKVGFLKDAEDAGFCVVLIFIRISSPAESEARVTLRVHRGGHDVPADKLLQRFPRTLENLDRAIATLSRVLVFDNSDWDAPYRLEAVYLEGKAIELE